MVIQETFFILRNMLDISFPMCKFFFCFNCPSCPPISHVGSVFVTGEISFRLKSSITAQSALWVPLTQTVMKDSRYWRSLQLNDPTAAKWLFICWTSKQQALLIGPLLVKRCLEGYHLPALAFQKRWPPPQIYGSSHELYVFASSYLVAAQSSVLQL